MKIHASLLFLFLILLSNKSCTPDDRENDQPGTIGAPLSVSFDGADYATEAEKVIHGKRLADLFECNACHLPDYSGVNFGEIIPLLKGLWATNISLTMPKMTDEELEILLREGVHPTRDLFVMPSKGSQFLSDRDMSALIWYLRTIQPTGKPTPLPPKSFRDSVSAKLPPDYWRKDERGNPVYHTSNDEVLYYREKELPDLGEELARGKLVAQTMCTSCHGASLDGVGEPGGSIQGAIDYDKASYETLLRDAVTIRGDTVMNPYIGGVGHAQPDLTDAEISAVIAYTKQLVRTNPVGKQ